jgi:hypothetical protein
MSSMQETVTVNTHEQKRAMVLNRILAGQLSAAEAAAGQVDCKSQQF